MEDEAFQAAVWDTVTAALQGGQGPEQLFQLARSVSSLLDQQCQGPGSGRPQRVDARQKVLLRGPLAGVPGLHAGIRGGGAGSTDLWRSLWGFTRC